MPSSEIATALGLATGKPALSSTRCDTLLDLLAALGCRSDDINGDPIRVLEDHADHFLDADGNEWHVLDWYSNEGLDPAQGGGGEFVVWADAYGNTSVTMAFPMTVDQFDDALRVIRIRARRGAAVDTLMTADGWDPSDPHLVSLFWDEFGELFGIDEYGNRGCADVDEVRRRLGTGWSPLNGEAMAFEFEPTKFLVRRSLRVGPRPLPGESPRVSARQPFVLGFDDNHVALFDLSEDEDDPVGEHRATLGPLDSRPLILDLVVEWLTSAIDEH